MPFIPTEKQVDSLYFLLKQLVREKIEIRLIRFANLAGGNMRGNQVEVFCFEEEDKYKIFYDGTIKPRF